MSKKMTFTLNREGVRELMRSEAMVGVLSEMASSRAKQVDGELDVYVGKNRVNVSISSSKRGDDADRALITAVYYDNQPADVAKTEKHIPVFFVSGEDDPVGDFGVGVKHAFSLYKKAGMSDVSMKLYPGDRHEILNETDREKVYADILEWMDSHI